jgi:hypothetical protein
MIIDSSRVAASVKNRLTLRESTEVARGQADLCEEEGYPETADQCAKSRSGSSR